MRFSLRLNNNSHFDRDYTLAFHIKLLDNALALNNGIHSDGAYTLALGSSIALDFIFAFNSSNCSNSDYRIYLAIRRGFHLSRMTTNNLISCM